MTFSGSGGSSAAGRFLSYGASAFAAPWRPGAFGPERVVYEGAGEPRHFALDEDDRVVIARSTMEALGPLEAARCYFDAADFEPPELTVV